MKTFYFKPSCDPCGEGKYYVIANDKDDAIRVLKLNGYEDHELTEDYSISRFADCFHLNEAEIDSICYIVYDENGLKFIYNNCEITEEEYYAFHYLSNGFDFNAIIKYRYEYPIFSKYIQDKIDNKKTEIISDIEVFNDRIKNIDNLTVEEIHNLVSKNRIRKYSLEALKNIIVEESRDSLKIETNFLNELNKL